MPRRRAANIPASPNGADDGGYTTEAVSQFKFIAELIAETDRNLPAPDIDRDIAKFSAYADVSDWKGIPKFFDSLSSISRRASNYENWENRFKVCDYLISCFGNLKDVVEQYIIDYFAAKANGEEHQVNRELVHAVLMFAILSTRLTVQLQLHVTSQAQKASQVQKKKRAGHSNMEEGSSEWHFVTRQRERMINCMLELLELKVDTCEGLKKNALKYVFAPETMEQDFLQRFLDTVASLLEDPENATRANQPWITHFFKIWKVLAADYQLASNVANSLFRDTLELGYLETANTFPFIEPLVNLMKDDGGDGSRIYQPLRVVFEMIIRRACTLYGGDRMDRPPPKAYCMIIQALAVHVHDLMLQEVSQVTQLLDNPHPNVRISTLQALADMFSSPYLSEALCSQYKFRKEKRELIFGKICGHTNDEATNVRAKAISLLRTLMENRRIPEAFESCGFVTLIGKRLNDKSVQVRKCAVQFLTAFLDNNRLGHDFNKADHIQKLDSLIKELRFNETPHSQAIQVAESEFNRNCYNVFRVLTDDVTCYLTGGFRSTDVPRSISELMNNLFVPGTTFALLQFYTAQPYFPFKPATYYSQANPPGRDKIDEISNWFKVQAKEDYIAYKTQLFIANDEAVIEDAQTRHDRQQSCLKLRAQMQTLIDKMTVESEISRCVDMALRCVLMGEAAEIKEGIKFLTRCKLFEITGSDNAIRSMCSLVWRPGTDVVNELIDAAEDIFISRLGADNDSSKISERDKSTVENLMNAMNGVTERDHPSVEQVIYLLASVGSDDDEKILTRNNRKRRPIEPNVITRLWSIALDNLNGGTQMKVDALRILFPISRTERGIPEARNRLRSLQKKLSDEPAVAVEALRIISILSTPTKLEREYNSYQRPIFRIHQDDSLWKSIEKLIFHEVIKADDDPKRDWFGIVRLSISTILNVGMDVNVLLPRLASQFLYRAQKISEFFIFYSKQVESAEDETHRANAVLRRDYWSMTWCRVMEKLMAFIGEVAVQLHAFIQVTIPKLHNRYITKMLEAEKPDAKIREEAPRLISELERSIAQRKTIFAVPTDTTPGTASNDLHHLVSLMCDKRLFLPSKLLGRLLPVVVYAMRAKTMAPRIRQAALIAYGKFMPISAEISSFAAPSFFTAMVHSQSSLVRCNLIAACCDFAFAQPTLFELYAPSLFRMSQDDSAAARESAILVLSHLMGNDMIQTRGVLSEPARCICDPIRSVKEVAQSFFKELNSRSDTIVQLLPEFLYRLSCTGERIPFKSYKIVFEFLIQLIKEKTKANTESMIDRVCVKFSNIDMGDDIAPKYLLVALAKFAQNDGGIHKLQDNWRHWSKFLCHSKIAAEYRSMIVGLESASKNEDYKCQCAELLKRFDKIQEEGLSRDDMAAVPSTSKRAGRPRKPIHRDTEQEPGPSTRTVRRRPRPQPSPSPSSEDSDSADSDDSD